MVIFFFNSDREYPGAPDRGGQDRDVDSEKSGRLIAHQTDTNLES